MDAHAPAPAAWWKTPGCFLFEEGLMNVTCKRVLSTASLCRVLSIVAALTLVLLLLPAAAAPALPSLPIQPILLQLADHQPDAVVGVIVQKANAGADIEGAVARLGGVVTRDLHIIRAIAARLPARAVVELARNRDVRWVSLDAPVEGSAKKPPVGNGAPPSNYFLDTVDVRRVWAMGLRGDGVTIAVVDSGVSKDNDFSKDNGAASRLTKQVAFSPNASSALDVYGHGTHIAGIIAGNGRDSTGLYSGIAPNANLIGLRVSDDTGMAYESGTVAALQWVLDNARTYNIRVVNLSVNSTIEQSYHTSPLDAACEILWFNQIVVVVSVGNKGGSNGYNTANAAPANDPFVITVGASDERGTTALKDDFIPPYSAHGTTGNGFVKPDIIAPGTNIVSVLSKNSSWATQYPDREALNGEYFRLSGTSMAAPMVAGAVALLLQSEPNLTPDQVKYRLTRAANTIAGSGNGAYYPYLSIYKAITSQTNQSANTGTPIAQLLTTGSQPVAWGSVNWNSVNWNSVNWNSVNWNSVNWNSVNWNGDFWAEIGVTYIPFFVASGQ
ncbi:MAG: S8 family peptidase [Chloroflexi bacterium]|nr:S8 family peptidase [Chloroflexota bacterium]